MANISHEWKVDFAVLLSLATAVAMVVKWIIERHTKARNEKTWAYEQVFEDANFILLYPHKKKRIEARSIEYHNEDGDFQRAVRLYIDSHWMGQVWGMGKYVPDSIKDRSKQYEYVSKVQEEARRFRDSVFAFQTDITLADLSPVFHMDNDEVATRFSKIMRFIGQHLSCFSPRIQRLWEDANYHNPDEVKHDYEKALMVCNKFFRHNPRDFGDPYYDILFLIRSEYRALKQNRIQMFFWHLRMLRIRIAARFDRLRRKEKS